MYKKPIVLGIGELLWDILPTGKRAGGAPVNVVYHASHLGAKGYAISAVGKDELGDELLGDLDKHKIDYIIPRVDYPTGTVDVKLKNGTPTYNITEDVAWDFIPITNSMLELVSKADAIAFGTLAQRNKISQETICKLLQTAPSTAIKYYDINLRQNYYSKDLIVRLLKLSSIIKINDEELEVVKEMFSLGDMSEKQVANWFMEHFDLSHFILTAGSRFSSIYSSDGLVSTIKTPKVKVADTVGAGDSFSGAFLGAFLNGYTLVEAHRKAVNVSAFVCKNHGAWPDYEDKDLI